MYFGYNKSPKFIEFILEASRSVVWYFQYAVHKRSNVYVYYISVQHTRARP